MDAGILHGLWTAAMLAVFAVIVGWAWSERRRRDFEEAARLPLEEDSEEGATKPRHEEARHG
ncbi:MAG: cbb3-type cytochrome c oxidase subunit 3 [Thiotrichales bacterium]|nr:cbb3-type cytochrome c oxidase subunit 3 [Thiotrichales bacterium]